MLLEKVYQPILYTVEDEDIARTSYFGHVKSSDRPRFFDQVGHQTNKCIYWK